MYAIRLQNNATLGNVSLADALNKYRNNAVVVAIVRRADGKEVVRKSS